MTRLADHWPAIILLALYFGLLIRHAIIGQRQTKQLADYYVGGRNMGGVVIGLSFFATFASTNSYVGNAGQAYALGASWLFLTIGFIFFAIISWILVAPRLRHFTASLNSITVPDFLGFRYSSGPVRVLAAVIVIFASLLYMTAIFKGVGNALQTYLDISYRTAIILVLGMVVMYTAVGGFISVVRTDVVQGLIMIVAAVLMFTGTVRAAGGLGAITELFNDPPTEPLFAWNGTKPVAIVIGIIVAGSMKLVVEPRMLSRFYALRDRRATRQAMWISTLAIAFVFVLLTPIGLYARLLFPQGNLDPDLVVPTLISTESYFRPEIASFLLVAIVAAAMSSLDSVLLVTGTTCHRDIVSLWRPAATDAQALRSTRLYVVVIAFVTAIIALNPPGGIVALTTFSGSLYAACFFPALIFGLYWQRGNERAVLSSMIVGICVLIGWSLYPLIVNVHAVFPSVILSTLCYVVVAYRGEPVNSSRLQTIFDEVRNDL